MSARPFLVPFLALLAAWPHLAASAQSVFVTPNPCPLDQPLTIQGTGFAPYTPILLWWDRAKSTQDTPAGNMTGVHPVTDATGSFSVKVSSLQMAAWPVYAGDHVLSVAYYAPYYGLVGGDVPVTLLPRQGYQVPPPIPRAAGARVSSGVIAYLAYPADDASTALMVTDGATAALVGSTKLSGASLGQPAWSPDGTRIALSAVLDTVPHMNVYVLDGAGRVSQVTGYGGSPPKLTGGGNGSILGSFTMPKPDVPPPTGPTDDVFTPQRCHDILDNAVPPKAGWATLVGTGMVTIATGPEVQAGEEGRYSFRFDNVPEGDYWLHAWCSRQVCQVDSQVQPKPGGEPGETWVVQVYRITIATANISVPVHVTAGQVKNIGNAECVYSWEWAAGPTWADPRRILYTHVAAAYERGGSAAISEAWMADTAGGAPPVQLSSSLTGSKVSDLSASPATGRVVGYVEGCAGLAVADLANFSEGKVLTSMLASTIPTGQVYSDSSPAWSPNGGYIAFTRRNLLAPPPMPPFPDDLGSPRRVIQMLCATNQGNLWLKNVATDEEWQVTRFNVAGGEGVVGKPAWSPDGSQIAITYTKDNFETFNVIVINLADGVSFALTDDGRSGFPSWTGGARLADLPRNLAFDPKLVQLVPVVVPGDIDGDGKVTVRDAVSILRFALGLAQPDAAARKAADLNADGRLDVADATKALRVAIGLATA